MTANESNFTKYALMAISSECNQKCAFCFEGGYRYDIPPKERLLEMIDDIARRGFERIVFIGGEATIARGVEDLICRITERGMAAHITTNGVALADAGFLAKLADAGLRHIEFSFHSHIKQDAASLSGRTDTSEKQARALKNIATLNACAARPVTVNTNTVVTTTNANYLPEMTAFLEQFGCVGTYSFKAPTIEGRAAGNLDLIPRFRDIAGPLQDVFETLRRDENRLIIDSVPLCALPPELLPCSVSFKDMSAILEGFNFGTRAGNNRFDMFSDTKSSAACGVCAIARICGGFAPEYVEMFSDREAEPAGSLYKLPPRIAALAAQCLANRGRKDIFSARSPGSDRGGLAEWAAGQAEQARSAGYKKINLNILHVEPPAPELPDMLRAVLSAGLEPVITSMARLFGDGRFVQEFSEFKDRVETELVFISPGPAGTETADPLFLKDCEGVMRLARAGAAPLVVAPVYGSSARGLKRIARLAQELGARGVAFLYSPQKYYGMLEFNESRVGPPDENTASNVRRAIKTALGKPGFAVELRGFPFEAFPDLHPLYKAPHNED